MPDTDIGNADYGDVQSEETKFSVEPVTLDSAEDQKETSYVNADWEQQLGYYKKIPELKAAIDALATWTIGKGYTANPITELLLLTIRGFGKDTFNTILENLVRVCKIGGDSFAEIIRDSEDYLINLKPLNPGKVRIVANRKGIVIRYELLGGSVPRVIKLEDMFHLSRNRTGDEIHGESLIDAVVEIILARNEAMETRRIVTRRFAKPLIIWHLDTDNPTEIASFKAKTDKAWVQGENFYIPKDAVVPEVVSVANNAILNLTPVINDLNNSFYQATQVPQIVVGGSVEITEASAKIAYLAWEQTIEEEQLYMEEQVLAQLFLEINLDFPASLQNEMLSSKAKEDSLQVSTPEDTSVTDVGVGEDSARKVGGNP